MQCNRLLVALLSLTLATAASAADVLIKFDGAVGSQPFRAANGVAASNTVAGVSPGGAPWIIQSFKATIKTTGEIRAVGKGLLLGGADGVGTRAGPRQVVASLFCRNEFTPPATAGTLQTAAYHSEFVTLDADGNFEISGWLTNSTGATPPLNCGDTIDNRPVLLIRNVNPANTTTGAAATPGAWFAAGLIAAKREDKDRD